MFIISADAAFEHCVEAKGGEGALPTTDSVYLLAFSIIMLHTNLHNPNIRRSERMTTADFIRNNKNYGADISKGRDVPAELLTDIYKQIAEEEFENHASSDDLTQQDDGRGGGKKKPKRALKRGHS